MMKKYKLGDICSFNKNTISRDEDINIEYLETSNLIENKILSIQNVKLSKAPSRAQRKVKHNTILYSTVRPNLKHYGIMKMPSSTMIVSTGFTTIDVLEEYNESVDPFYLYLLITQEHITNYLHTIAENATSAYPSISSIDLENLYFDFPSLKEQKKISLLFSSIDQKIALNRAINHNLEAMAKQLYDYWFVQFDFPNEEGKPYKSSGGKMVWNEKLKREIPEGWEVLNIFKAMEVQYGFPFATELFTEEETTIPIVRIRDIISNTISAYTTEVVDTKYLLHPQDLLIGMDGNFHINYWNDDKSFLNQRSVRIRAKKDGNVSIIQARYDIEPYIKAKELRTKGSTVGHLSDKDLKELYVTIPSNDYLKLRLDSILSKIISNRIEISTLTKQRDELLPLLMNGQVSVNYDLSLVYNHYFSYYCIKNNERTNYRRNHQCNGSNAHNRPTINTQNYHRPYIATGRSYTY